MYHADVVGRWQDKNTGKSGANTGFIQNETDLTQLAPFTIMATPTIAAGLITKPSDFIFELDLRINGYKVWHINHDQIDSVNHSVIDPPSVDDNAYYYTEKEGSFYLLPQSVTGTLSLDYIASCTDIVWGFTLDVDSRQVYDAGTSVQPKWNQSTIIEITKRALTNFGISYKDADFTNYGRVAQTTGD